ncbi:MAG: hypothetical protein ACLVKO_08225 [Dysgonomonas sp.]
MKERIFQLIEALNMSARSFSLRIGKSASFARTINNNIGADVVSEILLQFPQVNPYWLLRGEGNMFLDNNGSGTSLYEEPDMHSIASDVEHDKYGAVDYREKYIEELENKIKLLKSVIEDKDKLLEAFKNGDIAYNK